MYNYQVEGKIQQQAKQSTHFIVQNDTYLETHVHEKRGEKERNKQTDKTKQRKKRRVVEVIMLGSKMKILVITDISVLQFYGYIEYIGDISANILIQNIGNIKINKNSENIKKKSKKLYKK